MDDILRATDKISLINQLPLFKDLAESEKRLIAKSSTLVEFKKNEIVYRQGEPGNAFYCVVTGRLKAYLEKEGSAEEVLECLKKGKYFGLISLLTKDAHSVSVKAINDSILLRVPRDEFEAIIKKIPRFALRLSCALSRRAKRKDLHEKRVFESTIISIYGRQEKVGKSVYALNLSVSLKKETNKKVVLLSISKTGKDLPDMLRVEVDTPPLVLNTPFFEEKDINPSIFRHPVGIDMINIPHSPDDASDVIHIIPLLSYLTNDYHYIIVDLPAHMDKMNSGALKQSDMIHLVTSSDRTGLDATKGVLNQLKNSLAPEEENIAIITTEYSSPASLSYEGKVGLLRQEIFATLPDTGCKEMGFEISEGPIVLNRPGCEYSKTVRRISRQIGEVLVGLALGSGAAMGLAHIGIFKVMEREGIPIDIIIGTSMGALIGGLWAIGMTGSEIENVTLKFRKKLETLKLIDLTFPRRGLIKGRVVRKFLQSQLGDKTFYDLKVPFKVVTCDIRTREEVVIDEGSLVDAILASVSIPGIFEPVRLNGRLLVDGGIINPLPTNCLMKMGVNRIIAVNTLPGPEDAKQAKKRSSNIFDIIVNTVQASEFILAETSCQNADVVMHPVIPTVGWYEFYEADRIIKEGEKEALALLPQLKELTSHDSI